MKNNNFTKHIAGPVVTAICVGAFAMGAQAGEAPTRVVQYSVRDLDTPAGVKMLYRRIHSAAEQVCGDVHSRLLTEAMEAKACVRDTVDASIRSVDKVRTARAHELHVVSFR